MSPTSVEFTIFGAIYLQGVDSSVVWFMVSSDLVSSGAQLAVHAANELVQSSADRGSIPPLSLLPAYSLNFIIRATTDAAALRVCLRHICTIILAVHCLFCTFRLAELIAKTLPAPPTSGNIEILHRPIEKRPGKNERRRRIIATSDEETEGPDFSAHEVVPEA